MDQARYSGHGVETLVARRILLYRMSDAGMFRAAASEKRVPTAHPTVLAG